MQRNRYYSTAVKLPLGQLNPIESAQVRGPALLPSGTQHMLAHTQVGVPGSTEGEKKHRIGFLHSVISDHRLTAHVCLGSVEALTQDISALTHGVHLAASGDTLVCPACHT